MATAATNRMVNTTAQTSAGSGARLFVIVCHRRYSRRQLFANAAIAASRVAALAIRRVAS